MWTLSGLTGESGESLPSETSRSLLAEPATSAVAPVAIGTGRLRTLRLSRNRFLGAGEGESPVSTALILRIDRSLSSPEETTTEGESRIEHTLRSTRDDTQTRSVTVSEPTPRVRWFETPRRLAITRERRSLEEPGAVASAAEHQETGAHTERTGVSDCGRTELRFRTEHRQLSGTPRHSRSYYRRVTVRAGRQQRKRPL